MLKLTLRLLSLAMCATLLSFGVPGPQQGSNTYERMPNFQGMNSESIYPRWMSFTQVDPILDDPPDFYPPNENPLFVYGNGANMGSPSVAVDSRGVTHVVQRT